MLRPYNSHVMINNWFEDRALEEYVSSSSPNQKAVIKDYLEKKSKGQLLSQKYSDANVQRNVTLSTVNDGRIHIGDVVMLKCDATSHILAATTPKAARQDCYLASNGQSGSATGSALPHVNAFTVLKVKSVDGSASGSVIKFGQPFALTNLDETLYLHSNTRSYDSNVSPGSRLQAVDFTSVYNHECDWLATCLNPKFRLEAEGSSVPANEKVILLHMKTNKALGALCDHKNSSKFEIVAHTFLNSHRVEDDNNHWRFVTNVLQIAQPCRADSD